MGHIVETAPGRVAGTEVAGALRFAGIPYAAPPVGDLRFRAPRPHPGWSDVRDASSFGATSIQNPMAMEQMLGGEPEPQSEDCLFLNVFTPAADNAKRPVLFWIHGGAFVMGSGSTPIYDGAGLALRGDVVVVTINYRLGTLGYLYLGGLDDEFATSGNNATLDQIAALEWVRDNIEAFGGNPDDITIFGESAGGMSVGTLLGTPAAQGLFHKAIPQSGAAHNVMSIERATGITERFMGLVGAQSLDDLRQVSIDAILDAQLKFLAEAFTAAGTDPAMGAEIPLPYQPVVDGHVLPQRPIDAIAAGSAKDVPVLVGTCRDEWNLFAFMDPEPVDEELLVARLDRITGVGAHAAELYTHAAPEADPKARFGAAVTDFVFRQPAIRLAERQASHGAPTFMYLFTWPSSSMGGLLGSCHALELPFMWGTLDLPGIAMLVGDNPPHDLSEAMQDAWLAFARTGNPGQPGLPEWPAYDVDRRATMVLDSTCAVSADPEPDRRRFWETRL